MSHVRIVFTGGGSAGHVTPNLALIEYLQKENWQIDYIGSQGSIEESIIRSISVPFHPVASGKLRRYFSWKNLSDTFKILVGVGQCYRLLGALNTDIVFSKGGFVSFPVVFAAWLRRIPVVAHESDMSPGLANRLCLPFVSTLCLNFDASTAYFKKYPNKAQVTGTPIRQELFKGDKKIGLGLCDFSMERPCLMLIGGSSGSMKLNQILRLSLDRLSAHYQIIHLCGKGNIDESLIGHVHYKQFEYANQELAHLFAAADIVVSRSGANSLCELLALQKPHVLVPLSAKASRGDQIENARSFQEKGISTVIEEEALSPEVLFEAIHYVKEHREEVIAKMAALPIASATFKIVELLHMALKTSRVNRDFSAS